MTNYKPQNLSNMKKRLPRKIKKAILSAHLSLDKKFGYKMKKSALRLHMHLLYFEQLQGKKISYISPAEKAFRASQYKVHIKH